MAAETRTMDRRLADAPPARRGVARRRVGGGAWLRNAAFGAAIGTPLTLLGGLVLGIGLSPLIGLAASALLYGGLFMLLVWRPEAEAERDVTRDEMRRCLASAGRHVARLRGLAQAIRPHLRGDPAAARLEGIARLAERAIAELESMEAATLATASRLEFILAETLGVLTLFDEVAARESPAPGSLAPTVDRIEHDILGLVESSLMDLSSLLDQAVAENLDVAIRVLESTLQAQARPRRS